MRRTLKFICLGIAAAAFLILGILGFAIWVFIPLLPAGIVYLVAIMGMRRRRTAKPAEPAAVEPRRAA